MGITGIATAETLIDCIEEGRCDETTSDDVPWTDDVNITHGNCNGACCVDIQKVKYFVFVPNVNVATMHMEVTLH